jgi:branched-chain amino acid transport system substrate-binding protein
MLVEKKKRLLPKLGRNYERREEMSRLFVKPLLFIIIVMLIIAMFLSVACKEKQTAAKINPTAETASKKTLGVSDNGIRIGTLVPLSGPSGAAAWGIPVSKGMKAYYDYINDHGGIYGRKIKLIIGDNQYTGPVSSEAARKLVEQDGVFAIQGSLGTEAHKAIYQYLEDKGVPDMFILSGNTIWTDPVSRNRFGFLVDYVTEGRILGKYIGENFNGKKLGILEQNDDFGKEGEEGLRTGIEDAGAQMDIEVESYDAIQTDVTAQVQRLRNAGVDIIAAYAMPTQIGSLFKTARETLNWDVPMVLSGVDAAELVATLAGYDNIEGTISVTIGHQAFETDQPGIARHIAILQEYAPGLQIDNLTILGAIISETMVEILKQAGPDLTREGFLDAAESMCNYVCSMCITPFTMAPDDHRPVEVEMYVRATVDRSTNPPTFRWQRFGDIYGFETTKECVPPTPTAGYEK